MAIVLPRNSRAPITASRLKQGEPWRRSYIKWLQRAGWCAGRRLDWLSGYCGRVAAGLAADYRAEFGHEIDD